MTYAENLVVKAYQYIGVADPYTYHLKPPRMEKLDDDVQMLINALSSTLLCSIGQQVSPRLLLRNNSESQQLISTIVLMVQAFNKNMSNKERKIFLGIFQILNIVVIMNIDMYKNEKQNIQQIRYLLQELPSKFLDVEAVNIVARLLSFTVDAVMDWFHRPQNKPHKRESSHTSLQRAEFRQ